jgi:hypothetical protein
MKIAPLSQFRSLVIHGNIFAVIIAGLSSMGCAAGDAGDASDAEPVGFAQQAEAAMNGLTMNGLTMNGLTMNGLTMNGLTMNGLTMNGLKRTSDIGKALDTDALARKFFSYVVSCALPAGKNVVFPTLAEQTDYTFYGSLGVAPQWGIDGGSCDAACQQWVSACVISRVNALGAHVALSLRGDNAALASDATERAAYPRREATYFGNVLASPQRLFACRTATDDQSLIGRPCGNGSNVAGCLINVVGDCNAVCAVRDTAIGFYKSCATPSDGTFVQAVTVFRQ